MRLNGRISQTSPKNGALNVNCAYFVLLHAAIQVVETVFLAVAVMRMIIVVVMIICWERNALLTGKGCRSVRR